MPKKKQNDEQVTTEAAPVALITTAEWRGVKTVFKCSRCGTFRDEKDAMIEHVLLHFPIEEQEEIFNQLMKE